MKKVLIVFGTRPEAIKMAPIVTELLKRSDVFETRICVTAQHRQMLDQVLDFFKIEPDYDLNLMKKQQSLYELSANILLGLEPLFQKFTPDYLLVHGDTTTSMIASLAGFYRKIKVCHIEAGLRTNNIYSPYPEELNRQITSKIATYHFAPTKGAYDNLINEKVNKENIILTGNTVIDALFIANDMLDNYINKEIRFLKQLIKKDSKVILVTGHRRENIGEGFENICEALLKISDNPNIQIIYPVHLNPNVEKQITDKLNNKRNIELIKPLGYPAFIWLMKNCFLILTDSGGIQEEAPSFGKPVLVLRENTERPEAVEAGTAVLVGTQVNKIVNTVQSLLNDENAYKQFSGKENPYGNGDAAIKIVSFLNGFIQE